VKKIARIIATLAAALPALVLAQGAYPTKPVIVVVSTVPGPLDAFARVVCQKLQESLKQSFVVENKAGAGGNIAADYVKNAPADGYTLLFAIDTTFTVNPGLYKSHLPFNPDKDFATISVPVTYAQMLTVYPGVPAKTVGELASLAKQKHLTYASGGNGSPSHLVAAYFASTAGLEMTHVPYKGTGPATVDLLAGQVQLSMPNILTAMPHIRAGTLRALGVTGPRRAGALPDVPTIAEAGLPGYESVQWYGMLAPAGTPAAVVNKLQAEIVRAVHSPEIQAAMASEGADPVGSSADEFAAFIRAEIAKWTQVVKTAGIQQE
jgi:tripartite-type tricarboxylate transporter receptor subunit TctC